MKNLKKLLCLMLALAMVFALAACGSSADTEEEETTTEAETETEAAETEDAAEAEEEAEAETEAEEVVYKVGICNYVDDASLNQIVENVESQLEALGEEYGVTFEISYDNCNADATVLDQIIANFIADGVDLMVGVAPALAMAMKAATEDYQRPVGLAASYDPRSAGLVDSLEEPGSNITGTSDYLDTTAIMNLIFAADPDADKIGLLYDVGQDSSTTAIAEAKAYLDELGIEYVERTGTTVDEVMLAAEALVADGVDAVFTPSDNTVMTAELSIYETLAEAGIPHYTGANSFALNGAFVGYGVDYENLGVETANMVADILVNGADPATTAVMTFDNGTATVNTEICEVLGFDYDEIVEVFSPLCTQVVSITTAESFDDLEG
ncbi:MAG: ABC transporter substrate-binding protein [Oscillospiraceae bacterium]|nr:ABC transporter substrate-binding protein [Oscillospiraceae bacterium]